MLVIPLLKPCHNANVCIVNRSCLLRAMIETVAQVLKHAPAAGVGMQAALTDWAMPEDKSGAATAGLPVARQARESTELDSPRTM